MKTVLLGLMAILAGRFFGFFKPEEGEKRARYWKGGDKLAG